MLSLRNSAIGSDRPPQHGLRSRNWDLAPHGHFWRATFMAMGSPCELLCETGSRVEAESIAEIVAGEAWRIENKFSRYIPGNVVDRINSASGSGVEVDEETAGLIEFANLLYDMSDGRFDVTSGVLRRVWTFDGGDRVPSEAEILDVMKYVGWEKVSWKHRVLTMPAGMQIDLGGVGKEYAVDKALSLIREQTSIACLVNFGGDLAVTGPPTCQATWQIGREALQGPSASPSGLIQLKTGALATSGDTRRYLLKDGIRYSHILDPTTGWPIAGAPASITVAADTCVQAGVFCTLAMLRGSEAEQMLDQEGAQYWCAQN
jgi:thiamine biosynthesis lipoprotein